MEKIGNAVAALFIGAAVGVAVGYVLATDNDSRQEDMENIKKSLNNLKGKFMKKGTEAMEKAYNS